MADNNAVWTKAHYPEVLAPVGDFERLTFAVNYGADAVYLGGTAFGMRAASANFDFDTMKKAVEYCRTICARRRRQGWMPSSWRTSAC